MLKKDKNICKALFHEANESFSDMTFIGGCTMNMKHDLI